MRALKTILVSISCLFVLLAHAAAQSLPTAAPADSSPAQPAGSRPPQADQ